MLCLVGRVGESVGGLTGDAGGQKRSGEATVEKLILAAGCHPD
jgi:hypothetical protein